MSMSTARATDGVRTRRESPRCDGVPWTYGCVSLPCRRAGSPVTTVSIVDYAEARNGLLRDGDYQETTVHRIMPGWREDILRVHTLGGSKRLRVADYLVSRKQR